MSDDKKKMPWEVHINPETGRVDVDAWLREFALQQEIIMDRVSGALHLHRKAMRFPPYKVVLLGNAIYATACIALVASAICPPLFFAALIFFISAVIMRRKRPTTLILRAFAQRGVDDFLIPASAMMQQYGRVVLMRNMSFGVSDGIGNLSPPVYGASIPWLTICVLFFLGITWIGQWDVWVFAFLYVSVGSWVLLRHFCEWNPRTLVTFFSVSALMKWVFPHLPWKWFQSASFWGQLGIFMLGYCVLGAVLLAVPFFYKMQQKRDFARQVALPSDLVHLVDEINGGALVSRRYISNAPCVVDFLNCQEWTWRPTVVTLARIARRVVIDVSGIEDAASLKWEVEKCKELAVRILFICRDDCVDSARPLLEQLMEGEPFELVVWKSSFDIDNFDVALRFLEQTS